MQANFFLVRCMAEIQIIVGTVNGAASKTANAVSHVLRHQGHAVWVNDEPTIADLNNIRDESLLICCSTTGDGELPRNIYPLYLGLDSQEVDLTGKTYGVIALGDRKYRNFAQAGLILENMLYMSGAKRHGEIFVINAGESGNQFVDAAMWANQWAVGL